MRQPKPCSVAGCGRLTNVPGTAKGLCHSHYRRLKVYGDPLGAPPPRPTTCSVETCEAAILARGWCSMHWNRWYRHGSTDDPIAGNPLWKHCNSCDGVFPRDGENFHAHSSSSDGLSAWCKPCAAAKRRAHVAANREQVNEARRAAYWLDPDKGRTTAAKWRRRNPERAQDVARAGNHRRRAVLTGTDSEMFSPTEIFDRDSWRCGICGGRIAHRRAYPDPLSVSLDHVVPLARGGTHTRANTQAAHLRCNLRKHCGGTDQLRLIG